MQYGGDCILKIMNKTKVKEYEDCLILLYHPARLLAILYKEIYMYKFLINLYDKKLYYHIERLLILQFYKYNKYN